MVPKELDDRLIQPCHNERHRSTQHHVNNRHLDELRAGATRVHSLLRPRTIPLERGALERAKDLAEANKRKKKQFKEELFRGVTPTKHIW